MHQRLSVLSIRSKILVALVVILAVTSTSYSYATTIGTNISTAGTLTLQSDSASAVLFQSSGGSSTIFKFDNANSRFGILAGNALDTTFELGGAASLSGVFTQTGGTASNSFAGSLIISRGLTANAYQGGGLTACNSGQFLQYTAGQFGCGTPSGISAQSGIAANQVTFWQSTSVASGSSKFIWDTTNKRLGINAGSTVDTAFEAGGAASLSGAFTQTGTTASNSFAGSLSITKGLTANSYQGGGLSGCNSTQFLQYTAGQFGCGTAGTISSQSGIAAGQIAFWQSSTIASGSSKLFWDSTNKRFGLNYGNNLDTAFEVGGTASVSTITYKTATSDTNCSSTASTAACGSAAAGSVTVDAGSTTKTINTTAVTANSQIILTVDSSLGSRLSVTCNTTTPVYSVSSRTAGTSFVITVAVAPITNPACFNYLIIN